MLKYKSNVWERSTQVVLENDMTSCCGRAVNDMKQAADMLTHCSDSRVH